MQVQLKAVSGLDEVLITYLDAKRKIEQAEEQLKAARKTLEDACSEQDDGKLIIGVHKVTLSVQQRENFSLKDAKAVLGDALNPFIKVSAYTVLRVS